MARVRYWGKIRRVSITHRIQQLLSERPGLKAQQIADALGMAKSELSPALDAMAGADLTQDAAYRWWPAAARDPRAERTEAPRSLLARLCRYYLECLARESGPFISIPAAARMTEFIELKQLPFAETKAPHGREFQRMIQRTRRERGQLALFIGYGVRVRCTGQEEETRVEPVLLYPLEETEAGPELLRPSSGIPLFNLEVLKTLPAADSGNLIDEAIQLSEELGFANAEDELPQWDEVIQRLRRCRPEWDWREALDPYTLTESPPIAELAAPGIYNRAILFASTRSPFTHGLEAELRKLAVADENTVGRSALGSWLRGESGEAGPAEDRPILELLPLNTEQRQAVLRGLSAPLTVVTGPPGTGKSQVVISLLANMAWQGGSVLFASKNNHAVDVVESRINALGAYPLLLRLGKEEHQERLAQHLSSCLAESPAAGDAAGYEWLSRAHEESGARFAAVESEIASVVSLRNLVDELERAAEPARAIFGESRFAGLRALDADAVRRRLDALAAALGGSAGWGRIRRYKRAVEAADALRSDTTLLGATLPADPPGEATLEQWLEFHRSAAGRLEWAARAHAYWQAFDRLRAARPLEALAREMTRIADESARHSLDLWKRWLRLWPSRWNPEQRRVLAEFVSLLQIVAGGDRLQEGAGKKVFRRYYSLFPEVAKILSCWAVTSLSARGRLPFEPGIFDLVVIDEASQCDIASALPLLFRARRAVIIGDPLQLKHVSTVVPQQDRLLLAANGLAEGHAAWAYSVNSLFDLARSLCRTEDIVNLREHHRSHRDIITFSNRHFYRGGLRVATDHQALDRPQTAGPAVRWVDVKGKVVRPSRGGAVNPVEAQAVVAEVRRLILEQEYGGAAGVVTPFRAHANRIRALVHEDRELSGRLSALRFVVDTVHGFQGDEREVIFFSPVVSLGTGETTLRFLKRQSNLFNVAVTRARSELIVVGDRQAALDSGVTYLASFAEYSHGLKLQTSTHAPVADPGPEYPPVMHPEQVSEWERIFYKAMRAAGLRPVPQYEEAPFTLDFALFAGERKLDIEVDGEGYHSNWDGELCRRDQLRSRRLNDMGWEVMRFWVYEIRDELEASVARVRRWVERFP